MSICSSRGLESAQLPAARRCREDQEEEEEEEYSGHVGQEEEHPGHLGEEEEEPTG